MCTKSLLLFTSLFLALVMISGSKGFSQNVGIGTVTPAYPLDVNGAINSASEYRLFGKTIFRLGSLSTGLYRNFSAGDSAGSSNTTGFENTFIGARAGYSNVTGHDNTYIGFSAGLNSSGNSNTFVGNDAGKYNETGSFNTLLGQAAGYSITSGGSNTFLGGIAGNFNETGSFNVFVGASTGLNNVSGIGNAVIGSYSDVGSSPISFATAIGFRAYVTQSNSIILGSIDGVNGATADALVGIGTTAPTEKLDIVGNLKVSGEVNVVNIKVSGEINHVSTGTTNLLPIAFGSIASAGAINSGSTNFTVTRTAAGSYTIDITGQSYSFSSYSTVITVVGSTPLVAITTSVSGNLLVRLYNLSGVLTDGAFHFVVYKQ